MTVTSPLGLWELTPNLRPKGLVQELYNCYFSWECIMLSQHQSWPILTSFLRWPLSAPLQKADFKSEASSGPALSPPCSNSSEGSSLKVEPSMALKARGRKSILLAQ